MSGASSLFDAGVPEKIIQGRTGHRSLDALRLYKHVTDKQNQQVSKILSGQSKTFDGDSTAADNTTSFAICQSKPLQLNIITVSLIFPIVISLL